MAGSTHPGRAALAAELVALERAALRARAGRSRAEACREAGKSPKTVADWFSGKSSPKDFTTLRSVVEVLLDWRFGAPQNPTARAQRDAALLRWRELWKQADRPAVVPPLSKAEDSGARLGAPIRALDPLRGLEVHPAIVPRQHPHAPLGPLPVYIKRRHDKDLAGEVAFAQAGSRLVLLVGDSSTGKTRALWEAIQFLEGWRVWRPADCRALLRGLAEHHSVDRTVLWLNEIQRYLITAPHEGGEHAAAALSDLLTAPQRGRVLIVGTLWRDHCARLTDKPASGAGSDLHQHARALLGAGTTIPVSGHFDDDELESLRMLAADDPRLAEALQHGGRRITQYLAGARELLARNDLAPVEARALLDAAADARRLGHSEALPQSFLRAAAAAYLDLDHWRAETDDWRATWFERATAYTGRPSRGIPGALTRIVPPPGEPAMAEPAYQIADYLLQHLTGLHRHQVPPAGFWNAAAQHLAATDDLTAFGQAAGKRWRLRHANDLLQRAADAGNTTALRDLAKMREQAGDREGADRFYQRAADAGNTTALRDLAMRREKAGDQEGAEDLAQRAADAGDATALQVLAWMRENAGDREGAEGLYQRAADAGHTLALEKLVRMREKAGDQEGAEDLAQRAADAGYTRALENLARMREQTGDREGAEDLAQRAAEAGNTWALWQLAWKCERVGDLQRAEGLYQRAADAGNTTALQWLAMMREKTNKDGADYPSQRASDAGDIRTLRVLAGMREHTGDREGAEGLYQRVADAGDTTALASLARLRELAGDREGAEDLAQRAAYAGNTAALLYLAMMREVAGDREGAEGLLQHAADAGDTTALQELGWKCELAGNLQRAEGLYQRAADAGHTASLLRLAKMREKAGDRTRPWQALLRYGLEADGAVSTPWW